MNKKLIGLFVFFVVLFLSFCMEIKAMDNSHTEKIVGGEYRLAESSYIEDVRDTLETEGFYNAGINLDKATTEDGRMVYTLLIRHRRFDKIDSQQKLDLKEQLEKLTLDVSFSRVSVVFIDYID